MSHFNRRDFLKTTAEFATGAAVGAALPAATAAAQQLGFKPEPGAKLRVLRTS